jgi:hypothetical protein
LPLAAQIALTNSPSSTLLIAYATAHLKRAPGSTQIPAVSELPNSQDDAKEKARIIKEDIARRHGEL